MATALAAGAMFLVMIAGASRGKTGYYHQRPMVYGRAVQPSRLVILIAVLVGGLLAGILGALLAIPVAEIIRIVIS